MKKPQDISDVDAEAADPEPKPFNLFAGLNSEPLPPHGALPQPIIPAHPTEAATIAAPPEPLEARRDESSRSSIYISIAIAALVIGVLIGVVLTL